MSQLVNHGVVSAAHPLAADAAQDVMRDGGNAVDAAISAQAVIAVVMPEAAGIGGDLLALVREPSGAVVAINGTGRSAREAPSAWTLDGGASVTVPGLPDAWTALHSRWGNLPLARLLAPAIRLAHEGFVVDEALRHAVTSQRDRLTRYGGKNWSLLAHAEGEHRADGTLFAQPELGRLLEHFSEVGAAAVMGGQGARALVAGVRSAGGSLRERDLFEHRTTVTAAIAGSWNGGRVHVQPPASQGVLLAMAARWFESNEPVSIDRLDHLMVEATEAAFAYRDDVATQGARLLKVELSVDVDTAGRRGGPRGYLHTAGVAVADSSGLVVSSLMSVFDDFGSGVFVPELGIVLNNRAAGFTTGNNRPRPASRPVHTLAPAIVETREGGAVALATPGADGQVQTLLQILARIRYRNESLRDAIASSRWRSESGELLIETGHRSIPDLRERGHVVRELPYGDPLFGGVVCAGVGASTGAGMGSGAGIDSGELIVAADPRRSVAERST